MKAAPKWKLKKILQSLGLEVTLHKVTTTEIDTEYVDEFEDNPFGQTEESEETYTILAEIQPITFEDMAFLPAGTIEEGDAWGYFLPSYLIEGQDIYVEVNDYITCKGTKYLVTQLEDQYMKGETVLRRALLRRQVAQ